MQSWLRLGRPWLRWGDMMLGVRRDRGRVGLKLGRRGWRRGRTCGARGNVGVGPCVVGRGGRAGGASGLGRARGGEARSCSRRGRRRGARGRVAGRARSRWGEEEAGGKGIRFAFEKGEVTLGGVRSAARKPPVKSPPKVGFSALRRRTSRTHRGPVDVARLTSPRSLRALAPGTVLIRRRFRSPAKTLFSASVPTNTGTSRRRVPVAPPSERSSQDHDLALPPTKAAATTRTAGPCRAAVP